MYLCSTSGILQRCIPTEEGKALLLDVHEGVYGHHVSSRSMVWKAFQQGFYWPMTASDEVQIVRSSRGCQHFVRQIHAPTQEFQTISITWSFDMWGFDLQGPFKRASGGLTHLLIAVDKFYK
jgi:hypothetical protein